MAAVLVILLSTLAVAFSARQLPPAIRRLVALCFLAHLAGAAAQVWMHTDYYGGGDMLTYMRNGRPIARLVEADPARWVPELLRLLVHVDNELPFVHGTGGTSGTMVGIGAIFVVLFRDPLPLWEVCLLVGATSTLGQVVICKAALSMFPEENVHHSVALGILLVPSVVFWSSALTKEAIALPFLAILLASTVGDAKGRWTTSIFGLIVGTMGVGLVKGYLLMPFVLAVAVAAYVGKNSLGANGKRKFGWLSAVAAFAIAAVGLAGVSAVFPQYSPGSIAETTSSYQLTYEKLDGMGVAGSNVDFEEAGDVSMLGQLKLVPLAAVNALFRPMFFEARSVVQLAASFETLAVVVLLLRLLKFGPRRALREVVSSPPLAFCGVFVITFAVAVGLSTLNLGTLSRYRIPMMPFFTVLLFVLGQRIRAQKPIVADNPDRMGLRAAAARNRERILAQRPHA